MARKTQSSGLLSTDFEDRLRRLEELAASHGKELDIQFHRMAQLQAELDSLRAAVLGKDKRPASEVSVEGTKRSGASIRAEE